MWRLCTPLLISEKLPGCIISPLSVFKNWSYILLIWNLSLSAPNFEETLMVVIKHRGTAETAIGGVIEGVAFGRDPCHFRRLLQQYFVIRLAGNLPGRSL